MLQGSEDLALHSDHHADRRHHSLHSLFLLEASLDKTDLLLQHHHGGNFHHADHPGGKIFGLAQAVLGAQDAILDGLHCGVEPARLRVLQKLVGTAAHRIPARLQDHPRLQRGHPVCGSVGASAAGDCRVPVVGGRPRRITLRGEHPIAFN